jgi:hypothetical protein
MDDINLFGHKTKQITKIFKDTNTKMDQWGGGKQIL